VSQQSGELKRSKYRPLGLIGQGQFGQVFCAIHRQTGRFVALKNLEHQRFPTHKFLRELRFLLSLQHPNIVTCQALEHTATGRYLAMDYCEGGTLRTLITEEHLPEVGHSLKLVADVLAGLEHAHSRNIVHCDIKPENILLHVHATGWTARISDFGIARLQQEIIQQQSDTGSPAYMAPERFYGQYSIASDLYSVGILLFELLTGYRPFSGTPAELMSAHLNAPLKLPDTIPSSLQSVIGQALQKLPARRFRSAAAMLAALQVAETELGSNPSHPTDLRTNLFSTLVEPFQCWLQPLWQESLNQPITALAVGHDPQHSPQHSGEFKNQPDISEQGFALYRAGGNQLQQTIGLLGQADVSKTVTTTAAGSVPSLLLSGLEAIQQLLIRPQGCFVVRQRSVELVPLAALSASQPELVPIVELAYPSLIAVEPQGRWLAALTQIDPDSQLQFYRLPDRPQFSLAAQPVPLPTAAWLAIQPLDSRHLALLSTDPASTRLGSTTIRVFNRRGGSVGSLSLPLRLQQTLLTLTPYQLLATETDSAGTVLLIDLKPYRIKRLWVGISPAFLAAPRWGYILAAADGQIVFLDQEGRQVGTVNSPEPITAMTLFGEHGLLLATWDSVEQSGQLISLDLRTLGLDLVF
jgi:serine/threonine-protein kinase